MKRDQVSTGSICVTCKEDILGPFDVCNPDNCYCHEIYNKETLMDCGKLQGCKKNENTPPQLLLPSQALTSRSRILRDTCSTRG